MAKSKSTQTSFKTLLKTTAWVSFYWTANNSYYKLIIEERIQCNHCYHIWILTVYKLNILKVMCGKSTEINEFTTLELVIL